MSPTVSLNKKDYFIGDQVTLSGQAVPNTKVNLSIFGKGNDKSKAQMTKSKSILDLGFWISDFTLIRPVEAFTFPELVAQSDSKGNFSVNLPSSSPEKFRLFAQTDFKKSVSANSVKLNLEILPIWMIIIKFFLFLLFLIKPRLMEIIILAEIIYILYVLKSHFQSKAIMIYQNHLPEIEEEKSLIVIPPDKEIN
jgi:hypothetical protein